MLATPFHPGFPQGPLPTPAESTVHSEAMAERRREGRAEGIRTLQGSFRKRFGPGQTLLEPTHLSFSIAALKQAGMLTSDMRLILSQKDDLVERLERLERKVREAGSTPPAAARPAAAVQDAPVPGSQPEPRATAVPPTPAVAPAAAASQPAIRAVTREVTQSAQPAAPPAPQPQQAQPVRQPSDPTPAEAARIRPMTRAETRRQAAAGRGYHSPAGWQAGGRTNVD